MDCNKILLHLILKQSRVRVIFHERRLQYMEKEQMEHWKAVRPGERILDLGRVKLRLFIEIIVYPSYATFVDLC